MKRALKAMALILGLAMAFCALAACNTAKGKEVSLTYGEVGKEKHSYFPYAVVNISAGGEVSLKMGEAFGPTGKLWAEVAANSDVASDVTATYAYNNPWYPSINSTIKAKLYTEATIEALPVASRHFIKIGDRMFVLTVKPDHNYVSVRLRNVLVFREYKSGETADDIKNAVRLTDDYLAANMEWYLKAINEEEVFACDSSGTKRTGSVTIDGVSCDFSKCPADGAFLKDNSQSTYRDSYGLGGAQFTQAMKEIADYLVQKNFEVEFESAAKGNFEGLRIKDFDPEKPAAVAGASATGAFFQYTASYAKVAIRAHELALAKH